MSEPRDHLGRFISRDCPDAMVAAAAERLRQAFPGLAPDTYESIANALVLTVLDNLPVAVMAEALMKLNPWFSRREATTAVETAVAAARATVTG